MAAAAADDEDLDSLLDVEGDGLLALVEEDDEQGGAEKDSKDDVFCNLITASGTHTNFHCQVWLRLTFLPSDETEMQRLWQEMAKESILSKRAGGLRVLKDACALFKVYTLLFRISAVSLTVSLTLIFISATATNFFPTSLCPTAIL